MSMGGAAMNGPVSGMMAKMVHSAYIEDTIEKVEQDMNRHKLSSVPVVDKDNSVFGIISSGDLLRFNAEKKNPRNVRAWELCSYKPVSVSPDTPMKDIARLMLSKRIHHVLVTEKNDLKGIVSTFDLLEHALLKLAE
jgi:CBS domain-containing protein